MNDTSGRVTAEVGTGDRYKLDGYVNVPISNRPLCASPVFISCSAATGTISSTASDMAVPTTRCFVAASMPRRARSTGCFGADYPRSRATGSRTSSSIRTRSPRSSLRTSDPSCRRPGHKLRRPQFQPVRHCRSSRQPVGRQQHFVMGRRRRFDGAVDQLTATGRTHSSMVMSSSRPHRSFHATATSRRKVKIMSFSSSHRRRLGSTVTSIWSAASITSGRSTASAKTSTSNSQYCNVAFFPPVAPFTALKPACNAFLAANGGPSTMRRTRTSSRKSDSYAGYAQGNFYLNEKLFATLGGRYTKDKKEGTYAQTANAFIGKGIFRAPEASDFSRLGSKPFHVPPRPELPRRRRTICSTRAIRPAINPAATTAAAAYSLRRRSTRTGTCFDQAYLRS